jgi:hypothetical protein
MWDEEKRAVLLSAVVAISSVAIIMPLPRAKHIVHSVCNALGTPVAIRIIGGVHAAVAKTVHAEATVRGRDVCCHNIHLRSTLREMLS